ncbi:tetratricopeptide repeat protein, partial [Arsenicibacter rosenii]|uniref:tetratricopeptide repeat protein n=1 Tax=Arsenicibacter rosenii TaxID=1750698 RepID=UPI0040431183
MLNAELGVIHLHLHHFAESKRYFLNQLALSKKSQDKRLILIALGNLGTLYGANNRFNEAETCFRQSYEI